jgi:hypothetical protein
MSAGIVNESDLVLPEAVELLDGRVIIVHGSLGQGVEIFDPLTETFVTASPFVGSHACIHAERLNDGRVLIIDGYQQNSSELFTPGSDNLTATGSVANDRCYYASAALHDGRVLVTGYDLPAEIYDPDTGIFSHVGRPQVDTAGPTASVLGSDAVLVVGGLSSGRDSPWAELFDPVTGTFSFTGGLRNGHRFHSATVLEDGRVLVIGGCTNSPCTAELYRSE